MCCFSYSCGTHVHNGIERETHIHLDSQSCPAYAFFFGIENLVKRIFADTRLDQNRRDPSTIPATSDTHVPSFAKQHTYALTIQHLSYQKTFEILSLFHQILLSRFTMAIAPAPSKNVPHDGPEKELSPKQKQRLEEQKAREAKKTAKRAEKAMQRERRSAEKDRRDEQRERQKEDMRIEKETNKTQTMRGLEEAKRLEEEAALLAEEFKAEPAKIVNHVKKSKFDSNRLGGSHMA